MNQTIHLLSDTLPTINPDAAYFIYIATLFTGIGFALCMLILKIMYDIKRRKKDKEQNNY
ncbi:MAG: hypothetical protein ACOXZ9_03410 [Bacteroidales bacterium]|jgi:hypothetical protein